MIDSLAIDRDDVTTASGRRRRLRMLVTSAGRRVGLLDCFRRGAAAAGVELEIIACDLDPDASAACHSADAAHAVPRADDSGYADAVHALCVAHGVQLVVPTIDPDLAPLSAARARFADAGIQVSVSDPAVIAMARDKLATATFLAQAGIPSPRTATAEAVLAAPDDWRWPVFAKPRGGSAGRAVRAVASPADLAGAMDEPLVVQDLLRGDEYTVNIFIDGDGRLRCAIPHLRQQVRAGEVEKGVTRRAPVLEDIAVRLAAALPGARGALCFQAFVASDGSASVFEINARFGGGYPVADRAGGSFARWLVEQAAGLPSTANNHWQDGVRMLRYDAAVFVTP
ncbi:ATP-grasp domain-containing protein [Sandarakinorhabdus sp. DWP1-3-1]|uniref:ATP-grasp domain-containing protein n=1 Tax=Sandarakinorhabdus sp. DWP1-3-1 TaxID=2804627 RepID=UPI003CFB7796